MVKKILRLEGLAFFLLALFFYYQLKGNWLLFIVLLFTPDISMIGYLKDKKLGAILYNLMHNYILSIAILLIGAILLRNMTIILLGIILLAHVGLDRFLGFGLKYPSNFKDTHLQKV
jgi:Domain of unknown function (DUF4260)